MKPKIIVITGPTATGKSDLAVEIAKKYKGEIVSADSRQVYCGLDIGTGKITKPEMRSVPHYLLDVVSPKKIFNVSAYKKLAAIAIDEIIRKKKIPIICGGTGFYINILVDDVKLPEVKPNKTLRTHLEKKSVVDLYKLLKKIDPERAGAIDSKNKRRLIRAIEIAQALGKVPKIKKSSPYTPLFIALRPEELDEKIGLRLKKRIKQGMLREAENLHKKGLSYKRMEELGLEYRYMARFLQNKLTRKDFEEQLEKEIKRYSKRQITWFKKDKRIRWFSPKNKKGIDRAVNNFLA